LGVFECAFVSPGGRAERTRARSSSAFRRLRSAGSVGRPLGDETFVAMPEAATQRTLKPAKRGPKAHAGDVSVQAG
jgi:hypothetical protein